MNTFLAVFSLMALALVGMSAGLILRGKQLKGSCGGLSAMTNDDGNTVCNICGQDVAELGGSCGETPGE